MVSATNILATWDISGTVPNTLGVVAKRDGEESFVGHEPTT